MYIPNSSWPLIRPTIIDDAPVVLEHCLPCVGHRDQLPTPVVDRAATHCMLSNTDALGCRGCRRDHAGPEGTSRALYLRTFGAEWPSAFNSAEGFGAFSRGRFRAILFITRWARAWQKRWSASIEPYSQTAAAINLPAASWGTVVRPFFLAHR